MSVTLTRKELTSGFAVPKILEAGFTDRDSEHGEDKELPASVALTDALIEKSLSPPSAS